MDITLCKNWLFKVLSIKFRLKPLVNTGPSSPGLAMFCNGASCFHSADLASFAGKPDCIRFIDDAVILFS